MKVVFTWLHQTTCFLVGARQTENQIFLNSSKLQRPIHDSFVDEGLKRGSDQPVFGDVVALFITEEQMFGV